MRLALDYAGTQEHFEVAKKQLQSSFTVSFVLLQGQKATKARPASPLLLIPWYSVKLTEQPQGTTLAFACMLHFLEISDNAPLCRSWALTY